MSSKVVAFTSSILTPTVVLAYVDTYWYTGASDRYLSIGRNIVRHPQIKPILDDLHKPRTPETPDS